MQDDSILATGKKRLSKQLHVPTITCLLPLTTPPQAQHLQVRSSLECAQATLDKLRADKAAALAGAAAKAAAEASAAAEAAAAAGAGAQKGWRQAAGGILSTMRMRLLGGTAARDKEAAAARREAERAAAETAAAAARAGAQQGWKQASGAALGA
eukprot:scaffold212460_cov21-Tisochrysis_lutea.AAC.1